MKEVLYVIAGKRLPVVFHVGARALTSQALNIHAGHDDVMGIADTGWGILFARNPQEAIDLAAIARRAAEKSETPFFVGRAVAALAADPQVMKKSGGLFGSWTLSEEYGFEDVDGRRPHWGRSYKAVLGRARPSGSNLAYEWALVPSPAGVPPRRGRKGDVRR